MELLLAGLDMFERNPGSFTTGALARNAAGRKVAPTNPYARSWDMLGILLRFAGVDRFRTGGNEEHASNCLLAAVRERGHVSVRRANDEGGRDEALVFFRRALSYVESGPDPHLQTPQPRSPEDAREEALELAEEAAARARERSAAQVATPGATT